MVIFSKCVDCKRMRKEGDKFVCEAFPKEIPDEVFWNKKDHTKAIEGDNGIMFEPIDE